MKKIPVLGDLTMLMNKKILVFSLLLALLLVSCGPVSQNLTGSEQIDAQAQTSKLNAKPEKVEISSGPYLVINEVSGEVTARQTQQEDFTTAENGDKLLDADFCWPSME